MKELYQIQALMDEGIFNTMHTLLLNTNDSTFAARTNFFSVLRELFKRGKKLNFFYFNLFINIYLFILKDITQTLVVLLENGGYWKLMWTISGRIKTVEERVESDLALLCIYYIIKDGNKIILFYFILFYFILTLFNLKKKINKEKWCLSLINSSDLPVLFSTIGFASSIHSLPSNIVSMTSLRLIIRCLKVATQRGNQKYLKEKKKKDKIYLSIYLLLFFKILKRNFKSNITICKKR